MYNHPAIATEYPTPSRYRPGQIVQHRCLPGVDLEIIGGPHRSLDGDRKWWVRTPDGKTVPVLERNLR